MFYEAELKAIYFQRMLSHNNMPVILLRLGAK